MRPIAAALLAAAWVTASASRPASPRHRRTDALLAALTGRWEGTGTILDQPARAEMEWTPVLSGRFVRLTWVSHIGQAPKTQRFEGIAYYQRTPPGIARRGSTRAGWRARSTPSAGGGRHRHLGHARDRARRDHLSPRLVAMRSRWWTACAARTASGASSAARTLAPRAVIRRPRRRYTTAHDRTAGRAASLARARRAAAARRASPAVATVPTEPAETLPDLSPRPFRFTGSGSDYFRIWIVNLLLSVLTLGIYSAWAKVRRLRYFYGHTSVDGGAFGYHASPVAILKGRLIAYAVIATLFVVSQVAPLVASVLYLPLVVLMPIVLVRAFRFRAANSSYRGIRFGFDGLETRGLPRLPAAAAVRGADPRADLPVHRRPPARILRRQQPAGPIAVPPDAAHLAGVSHLRRWRRWPGLAWLGVAWSRRRRSGAVGRRRRRHDPTCRPASRWPC